MRCEVTPFPALMCKVGETEVYTGRALRESLGEYLDALAGGGRVLVTWDGEGKNEAKRTTEALRGFGLRVTEKPDADVCEAEENCLVVLGVGGERAASAAKRAAADRGADCVLMPVIPCEDGLLAGGRVTAVCLDAEVLEGAPRDSLAAAAGILFALPLRRFEDVYAEKVLAEPHAEERVSAPSEGDGIADTAVKVMRAGASGRRYAADVTAEMLRLIALSKGKKPRRKGEYVFVAACALAAFYKAYLSSPAADTLIPADHCRALDELVRLKGGEEGNIIQAFDIFDVSGYFRINYILGEYRLDLIAELAGAELGTSARRWRRMYDDAGFWMKSAFTSGDMIRAMALAGETAGGLLGFASATGVFDAMERAGKEQ